jgi:predicted peptidase
MHGCPIVLLIASLAWTLHAVSVDDFLDLSYSAPGYSEPMRYRLFVPRNYVSTKKYPLVLFLHGCCGCGDNRCHADNGPCLAWAQDSNQAKNPCFVLAPQVLTNKTWVDWSWGNITDRIALTASDSGVKISTSMKMVIEILQDLKTKYALDTTRFYVTGYSMGGWGTWDIITRRPELFAAAIPICGGGDTSKASRLINMGVWAFHGDKDDVIPFQNSVLMIAALEKAGGTPKHTWIAGCGHNSWDPAYSDPQLLPWTFRQVKNQNTSVAIADPSRMINTRFDAGRKFKGRVADEQTGWRVILDPQGKIVRLKPSRPGHNPSAGACLIIYPSNDRAVGPAMIIKK